MNHVRVEYMDDGVAVVHFASLEDKVNKLSEGSMDELDTVLYQLEHRSSLPGVILISDKEDSFVVGADLRELDRVSQPGIVKGFIVRLHGILRRLESLPCPVLAAIHGSCLGGGLEVALACHYRIATDHPRTSLGLPEVKLGLIPAGGGTQRLPRLIGIRRAMPLMLRGYPLNASSAKSLGLIDLAVYPFDLLTTARRCIEHYRHKPLKRGKPFRFPSADWALYNLQPARRAFFNYARKQVLEKTQGHYPAPLRLIDCVETGIAQGMEAGLATEADGLDELVLSPESRELRRLFFQTTAMKKNPLAAGARPVRCVSIVGSGLMGSGIASVTARAGISVALKDVTWQKLAAGLKSIWTDLDQEAKRSRQNPVERDKAFSRITPGLDGAQFDRADVIIEAVFEDLALKRQILKEAEAGTARERVFASNTSAIPIAQIAEVSSHPEAVVGMHYFSPVPKMPLLEVVVTPQTADWARATVVSLGQRQGKTVIVVKDGPGFYTSRILATVLHEAIALLREGAEIQRVDSAMSRFGFPVGPFKLLDEVGIDVAAHASASMEAIFTGRGLDASADLKRLVDSGLLGRKSGKGFYIYEADGWRRSIRIPGLKPGRQANGKIYEMISSASRKSFEDFEIQQRVALIMSNEAVLCLSEGIIASGRDGDIGAVLGLGFPPFIGGPFRYLEKMGLKSAVSTLQALEASHGPRFCPAPLLVDLAEREGSFS